MTTLKDIEYQIVKTRFFIGFMNLSIGALFVVGMTYLWVIQDTFWNYELLTVALFIALMWQSASLLGDDIKKEKKKRHKKR